MTRSAIATTKRAARGAAFAACNLVTRADPRRSSILMYHSIGGSHGVDADALRDQLRMLAERFTLCRVGDLPSLLEGEATLPLAALTFDDGLLDNYEIAVPILETVGAKGTFFLTSSFLGKTLPGRYGPVVYMSADHARALADRGHEIGGHTVTHPKLTEISHDAARREIAEGKSTLEDVTGTPCRSFAYPSGRYDREIARLVGEAGFEVAVTTREAALPPEPEWLKLPRVSVTPTTSLRQLRAKLSPALDLYERLRLR